MNQPIPRSTRTPVWRFALLTCLALSATRAVVAAPEFLYLGDLPGGLEYSIAFGVSADGTYVVGGSSSTLTGANEFWKYTEAFVWDRNRGMVGLGRMPGGLHDSSAYDVTADGNVVVGKSMAYFDPTFFYPTSYEAFRWTRGGAMERFGTPEPGLPNLYGVAAAVTASGSTIVGALNQPFLPSLPGYSRAFVWSSGLPTSFVRYLDGAFLGSEATAINSSNLIVGSVAVTSTNQNVFRWDGTANPPELLGRLDNLVTVPTGVSSDGRTIVGRATDPQNSAMVSAFVWRQGANPAFKKLRDFSGLLFQRPSAIGVSADGRVLLDQAGGLYLDDAGPFDLKQLLAEAGVVDLLGLPASAFNAHGISDNGLACVGAAVVNGVTKAWRVRLTDCDANGLPDELERAVAGADAARLIARGTAYFADQRNALGYDGMIKDYGRPWKVGSSQTPAKDPAQPAEMLRALLRLAGCSDSVAISAPEAAEQFLATVAFPAVRELSAFEMLLGNEAFADALDPTIGLDGIPAGGDINDQYAFRGATASGVEELLDEELVLLRGRELPGTPADWLSAANEDIYYPEYTGISGGVADVAVYNRLPPNATGRNGIAYRSNYQVSDNYEAALKFPQGHGDAYGHYLSAVKVGITLLKDGPTGWLEELLEVIASAVADSDLGLEAVRDIASAAAARAQTAAHVAELTHRRDYRENLEDPQALEVFVDPDPERAWSMADWARRGAAGAYLDWTLVSHWAPTDTGRPVHRGNLPELDELAGAVSSLQGRLDTAGAGLDPLGLLQNVVPFGIEASGLGSGEDRSHFDQIRDAAQGAVDNARKAFEVANESNQRLRGSDEAFADFANRIEDTRADHDQQLIEIFGLASPDDPADNDDDAATDDFTESRSAPDLTNFMDTDEALTQKGMRGRLAPGQVQLALSEVRVAALRVEQAELALENLAAEIREQEQRILLLSNASNTRIKIISTALEDQIDLAVRLEQIEKRKKKASLIGSLLSPGALIGLLGEGATYLADYLLRDDGDLQTPEDIELERLRVQAWKELELQGLEDSLRLAAEADQLKALLRRSPQLLLDVAAAEQVASQALGRLHQAIVRGKQILQTRRRLVARTQGQELDQRWKDMSFRVFRNAALKNYRAFFDIAARYVVLAARAYAYEFETLAEGEAALAGIHRERRLGGRSSRDGGLQGVLTRLDDAATAHNRNRPLTLLDAEFQCGFRTNFLGLGNTIEDGRKFRAWVESQIVDRMEDIPQVRDLAQISRDFDHGPAIVIPYSTEVNGRNFFGRGPEPPYNRTNFERMSSNPKLVKFAIRLVGASTTLGTDPNSGAVTVYLLPVGDSVLRESTNKPTIEDELIQHWAVVDQFLPVPSVAGSGDLSRRSYNPWSSSAQAGGNFLNEIKRQTQSVAQIELGQVGDDVIYNTQLAGRSVWNTRWLLIIPGRRFVPGATPDGVRAALLELIHGPNPENDFGMEDIYLFIKAYTH